MEEPVDVYPILQQELGWGLWARGTGRTQRQRQGRESGEGENGAFSPSLSAQEE